METALCSNGHLLGDDNVYVEPRGRVRCRICKRERTRRSARKSPSERRVIRGPLEMALPKRCPKCGVVKDLDCFANDQSAADGRTPYCRPCLSIRERDRNLRRKYGLTVEQYDALLASQRGGCAICGASPETERYGQLTVDHDHQTGVVRGLLCMACNLIIGHAKDDVERLRRAMEYVEASN